MAKKTRDEVEPVLVPYGSYQLTRDVKNPSPDRRRNGWLNQAVWEKGTRFIIEDYAGSVFMGNEMEERISRIAPEEREVYRARMRRNFQQLRVIGADRYQASFVAHQHAEAFNQLVTSCEQIKERTLDVVLAEKGYSYSPGYLLKALLDMKRLTLKDIEEAVDFVNNSPEEEG